MYRLVTLLLFMTMLQTRAQQKPELLYVYDALCGWCYGFSGVITEFVRNYKDELTIEVISGGMITGSRVGPVDEIADYIRGAYKQVESRTGVTFGEPFLNGTLGVGTTLFTSLTPAIALSIAKTERPETGVAFATRIQKAIYYDGVAPSDTQAYANIAGEFGMDVASFGKKMADPFYAELAMNDFKKTKTLNVTGFPTVIVRSGTNTATLAEGYVTFRMLESRYLNFLHNQK